MNTLAGKAERPGNNFDALRFGAAVMVVFAHAYALTGHAADEPLSRHTSLEDFGSLGVSIFFVISGFLITASYMRRPNLPAFLANRVLRLLPALAVVTLVSALVIGPLVTTLPLGSYVARSSTWLYPVRNVLIFPVDYALPGVFGANPYPIIVNGSLWTLRLEVGFYLVIAFLGWRRVLAGGALTVVLGALVIAFETQQLGLVHAPTQALIFCRTGVLFFAGALAYATTGEALWRSARGWLLGLTALVAIAVAAEFRPAGMAVAPLMLTPLVLGLAFAPLPLVRHWGRIGDLSYGVYLWAFPVGQVLLHIEGSRLSPVALALQSLALVIPLAAASWWLVERSALGAKRAVHDRLARFDEPPIAPGGWGDGGGGTGSSSDKGLRELAPPTRDI